MRGTKRISMWLRALLARPTMESELDEEMRFHIDMERELLVHATVRRAGNKGAHTSGKTLHPAHWLSSTMVMVSAKRSHFETSSPSAFRPSRVME